MYSDASAATSPSAFDTSGFLKKQGQHFGKHIRLSGQRELTEVLHDDRVEGGLGHV